MHTRVHLGIHSLACSPHSRLLRALCCRRRPARRRRLREQQLRAGRTRVGGGLLIGPSKAWKALPSSRRAQLWLAHYCGSGLAGNWAKHGCRRPAAPAAAAAAPGWYSRGRRLPLARRAGSGRRGTAAAAAGPDQKARLAGSKKWRPGSAVCEAAGALPTNSVGRSAERRRAPAHLGALAAPGRHLERGAQAGLAEGVAAGGGAGPHTDVLQGRLREQLAAPAMTCRELATRAAPACPAPQAPRARPAKDPPRPPGRWRSSAPRAAPPGT